jgi:hypothetical protein
MAPSSPLQTSQTAQQAPAPVKPLRPVPLEVIETAHCDLCGQPLSEHAGHFAMTSPLTARKVTVCRTCRRAALSEGYHPRI